jgi:hypothetical protein
MLQPNQIYIFGSNAGGFHGAGSAGLAMRGNSANTWRTDPVFLQAKNSPPNSPHRIGKWAVFGIARGFQTGHCGMSYAIETIQRPGLKRSTPLHEIEKQFLTLFQFAEENPQWEFLMTNVGATLAGYSKQEMLECWNRATTKTPIPTNITIPKNLYL